MENKEINFIKVDERLWRRTRKIKSITTLLAIIFFILAIQIFLEGYSLESLIDGKSSYEPFINESINYNNSTSTCDETSLITESFMTIVTWNNNLGTKILVFLGIVYLIQIVVTMAFDVLEIIVFIGLLITKIFKGIIYLIKLPFNKNANKKR